MRPKTKYLTNEEKDRLITDDIYFEVEKLEKRYHCTILLNIDDIIFNKK